MGNLAAAAQAVATRIGPGNYEDGSVNARSYHWSCGPARLNLFAFPPELEDRKGSNAWHEREPRLIEACEIWIESGYRPPLAPAEAECIERFDPVLRLHDGHLPAPESPNAGPPSTSWLARLLGAPSAPVLATRAPSLLPPVWDNPIQGHVGNTSAAETALEYTREPPPAVDRVFGWLGSALDGAALIWCDDQLRIVPRDHVRALRHKRFAPERGDDGSSELSLLCRRPDKREVEVPLVRRNAIDALDQLAEAVAAWAGVPLDCRDWI